MWREVPKEQRINSDGQYGSSYNKSYLPSGNQVQFKTFGEQREVIDKFFIDDWNRRELKYPVEFHGEAYHLI